MLEAANAAAARVPTDGANVAALVQMRHVGYQEDQYVNCTCQDFAVYAPRLLAALCNDGHELQPTKSRLWILALGGIPQRGSAGVGAAILGYVW